MLSVDITHKCLVAEGWCPVKTKPQVSDALTLLRCPSVPIEIIGRLCEFFSSRLFESGHFVNTLMWLPRFCILEKQHGVVPRRPISSKNPWSVLADTRYRFKTLCRGRQLTATLSWTPSFKSCRRRSHLQPFMKPTNLQHLFKRLWTPMGNMAKELQLEIHNCKT